MNFHWNWDFVFLLESKSWTKLPLGGKRVGASLEKTGDDSPLPTRSRFN